MENEYSRDKHKEKDKKIELECPHCYEKNSVKLAQQSKCEKCQKSFSGHFYKSVVLSAGLLLGVGAVGGALIDDTINLNRASVKTEYKMMKTCIDEFKYRDGYKTARDKCYDVVESMSGFLDAEKARFYGKEGLEKELAKRYNAN